MLAGKKSWRVFNDEKKKRKAERVVKKLDKMKAKQEKQKVSESQASIVHIIPTPKPTKQKTDEIFQTCSIAVPGSILENAQTMELRTYVAGQIARAAAIYKVAEIIIFDDSGEGKGKAEDEQQASKSCLQFARLLQYLECPQYLRKHFFPIHKDLQFIGLLNPLDSPHHLRQTEESEYREGITTTKQAKSGRGSYVNVGLAKDVKISDKLEAGLRVTVKLYKKEGAKKLYGTVVSPDEPFKAKGIYWGYTVRIAHSLSEVMTKCPYPGGYDVTLGTSDKGKCVDDLKKGYFGEFEHVLVVFGGLKGLEAALEVDDLDVETPDLLFDHYLNTCPSQGSRTIRTEEAVLITLAELRRLLK